MATPLSSLEQFLCQLTRENSLASIVLLLDGSDSILPRDWTLLQLALRSICHRLPIRPPSPAPLVPPSAPGAVGHTLASYGVAVVQFSSHALVEVDFTYDPSLLYSKLLTIQQMKSTTQTTKGLQACVPLLASAPKNSKNYIFLFTDGKADADCSPSPAVFAASKLHSIATIVCIGIGSSVNQDELLKTASTPQLVFNVPSVSSLDEQFSRSTPVPDQNLVIDVAGWSQTEIFLSVKHHEVSKVVIELYSSSAQLPAIELENLLPNAPTVVVDALKPGTEYKLRAKARLTSGAWTGFSDLKVVTTLLDRDELLELGSDPTLRTTNQKLVEDLRALQTKLMELSVPRANVLVAGPGNSGKSTLFNALYAIQLRRYTDPRQTREDEKSVSLDLFKSNWGELICFWDFWGWNNTCVHSEELLRNLTSGRLEHGFSLSEVANQLESKLTVKEPTLAQRVHAIILVFPVFSIDNQLETDTLKGVYRTLQQWNYRPIVLISKVDNCQATLRQQPVKAYASSVVAEWMRKLSVNSGIPAAYIYPLVNILEPSAVTGPAGAQYEYLYRRLIQVALNSSIDYLHYHGNRASAATSSSGSSGAAAPPQTPGQSSSASPMPPSSPAIVSLVASPASSTERRPVLEVLIEHDGHRRRICSTPRLTIGQLIAQLKLPATGAIFDEEGIEYAEASLVEDTGRTSFIFKKVP